MLTVLHHWGWSSEQGLGCSKPGSSTRKWHLNSGLVVRRKGTLYLNIFPGGSVVKNMPANTGDMGLIPGLGRSPGEGNGNLLQYCCLENPMDRGALPSNSPWGCQESNMTEQLNDSRRRGLQK